MELIRGLDALNKSHRPSVVTIGNFDGVHLGHQYVIESLLAQSKLLNAPSTVITFEPLAKEYFDSTSVMRLTTVEQRADVLFGLGVDRVLCIDFNAGFVEYSPQGFVQDVLIDGLGTKYLSVGDDFRFGKDRAGDFDLLQAMAQSAGFVVSNHDTFTLGGERVSSGRIRQALLDDDFTLAQRLLGRAFSIDGCVSKGQQLGRTINYPTANIVLDQNLNQPVKGVYAVTTLLPNGTTYNGVANVGRRPTVDGLENRLEVHLFDFDEDIYGKNIQVQFHHKIRNEHKFANLDELKLQIGKDAESARQFFQTTV